MSHDEVQQVNYSWRRLLIELELARNYSLPFLLNGLGRIFPKNPIIEKILPSLFHIKAVAILDFALKQWIVSAGPTMSRRYGDNLKGRIDFLQDQEVIPDAALLHHVRNRRNDIAHEFEEVVSWDILEQDITDIHTTLHTLGFVPVRPRFEFFAERSSGKKSEEPEVAFAFDYSFGVREEEAVVAEVTWTEKIFRTNAYSVS